MRTGIVALVAALAASGCGPSTPGPKGPPPGPENKYVEVPATPPKLGQVAYRPTFTFGGRKASAGTAFVVKAKSGDKYMLTAAHLFEPDEWKTVSGATLATMGGEEAGRTEGAAKYIGVGMDTEGPTPVTDRDLVIWKLAAGDRAEALPLATRVPNTNRLWVVGAEVGKAGPQRTFECKPEMFMGGGSTVFRQTATFALRAFSGGPIVDHEGKVVATLLGGGGGQIIGTSVENVRKRLAENGVEVE